jgi:hypothetical protein
VNGNSKYEARNTKQIRISKRPKQEARNAAEGAAYKLVRAVAQGRSGAGDRTSERLLVERLPESVISARRSRTCTCVHSRTDTDHSGPLPGASLWVTKRHWTSWI